MFKKAAISGYCALAVLLGSFLVVPVGYAQNKNTVNQSAACQASSLWCVQTVRNKKKSPAKQSRRTDYVKDELLLLHDASRPVNFAASVLRKYNLREKSSSTLDSIGQRLIAAGANGQDPLELATQINEKEKGIGASANHLFFTTSVERQARRNTYPLALTGIAAAHQPVLRLLVGIPKVKVLRSA